MICHLYQWKYDSDAEVDFIIQCENKVIPIEVNGADNSKSKNLCVCMASYKNRGYLGFLPDFCILK